LQSRISTLLILFDYCFRKLNDSNKKIDIPEILKPPDEIQPIAPENVRDSFREAFRIFAENIWFEDQMPRISRDNPYFIKSGVIFLHVGPRESGESVELSSLNKASLESFASFLQRAEQSAKQI
jgi:hypothetical protein